MKIDVFDMERMQSTWENLVDYDMSESGVRPVTLRDLVEMGFDLEQAMDVPLGYSQSNGTPRLKDRLAAVYPGARADNIEVTNGTSEANYLIALSQLARGDQVAFEVPNYMQLWGVPKSLGARLTTFGLRLDRDWEPAWDEFERAVNADTKLVYVSNPNNPTGSVLSDAAMARIVRRCDEVGAYLVADEVYQGAEIGRERTRSFWGMSDRVIVTSGLSKAYGIPGVRIGWIVGPPEVVGECWSQHDYLTIGPNKLSDLIARTAVENRDRLYARTHRVLSENLPVFTRWLDGLDGFLSFRPPEAGAIAFVKYDAALPSCDIAERVRRNRSTLIVPGRHLGMEGYLRIWIGGRPEFMEEGLRRIGAELRAIAGAR